MKMDHIKTGRRAGWLVCCLVGLLTVWMTDRQTVNREVIPLGEPASADDTTER